MRYVGDIYGMKEYIINKNEDGQRLDRVLHKLLPSLSTGLMYKFLRNKDIVLNNKKVEAGERLSTGDVLRLFFSEETYAKFAAGRTNFSAASSSEEKPTKKPMRDRLNKGLSDFDFETAIIYEDEDIILVNKPVGMLSQPASAEAGSLNDYLYDYLKKKGKLEDAGTFKPSVCNRLDRNTSGIVFCGSSLKGLRFLSDLLRTRSVDKYYVAVCKGELKGEGKLKGYLMKDEKTNKVSILHEECEGSEKIETYYRPMKTNGKATLVEVKLVTGKPHQIRAHMASIGYPVGGDMKYGDEGFNRYLRNNYKVRTQLLMAYRLVFPKITGDFERFSEREFVLKLPSVYRNMF